MVSDRDVGTLILQRLPYTVVLALTALALATVVGFTLGYDYDSFPEGGADVAKGIHSGTIGVNYTGREDFHFGFETQVSTLKQTDVESTLAAMKFVLNLRYYF